MKSNQGDTTVSLGTRSISQSRLHFFKRINYENKNGKFDNDQESDGLNKKFSLKNLNDFIYITPSFKELNIGL